MASFFDKLPGLVSGARLPLASSFDPLSFLSRKEPKTLEERFKEARALLISEPHTALRYLESAAGEDHAASLDLLGMLYATGQFLEKNEKRATELFRKAATLGDVKGKLHLAMALREGFGTQANPTESFAWLRLAAKEKLPEAIYALAECYETGIGTEKNRTIAEGFFSEAAFKGNPAAIEHMLMLATEGDTPNPKLALRWLFKGAEASIPFCLLAVGRYWLEYRPSTFEKGVSLLEEGALLEDLECIKELSSVWSNGRFVTPDPVSALVYCHLAATQNDWRSREKLLYLRENSPTEVLSEAAEIASFPGNEFVIKELIKRRKIATQK